MKAPAENTDNNENWAKCPACGEPVMIDPNTGKAEPCATCASLATKQVGVLGVGVLLAGAALVVGVVYYCLQLL